MARNVGAKRGMSAFAKNTGASGGGLKKLKADNGSRLYEVGDFGGQIFN